MKDKEVEQIIQDLKDYEKLMQSLVWKDDTDPSMELHLENTLIQKYQNNPDFYRQLWLWFDDHITREIFDESVDHLMKAMGYNLKKDADFMLSLYRQCYQETVLNDHPINRKYASLIGYFDEEVTTQPGIVKQVCQWDAYGWTLPVVLSSSKEYDASWKQDSAFLVQEIMKNKNSDMPLEDLMSLICNTVPIDTAVETMRAIKVQDENFYHECSQNLMNEIERHNMQNLKSQGLREEDLLVAKYSIILNQLGTPEDHKSSMPHK